MAASAWKFYDPFGTDFDSSVVDFSTHAFRMSLYGSTSNAETLTHDQLTDITGELASTGGYTTGGAALVSSTWVDTSAGRRRFSSNAVTWNATGTLSPVYAVIWDDTSTADQPVCFSLLSGTTAALSIASPNALTISPSANGWFELKWR